MQKMIIQKEKDILSCREMFEKLFVIIKPRPDGFCLFFWCRHPGMLAQQAVNKKFCYFDLFYRNFISVPLKWDELNN